MMSDTDRKIQQLTHDAMIEARRGGVDAISLAESAVQDPLREKLQTGTKQKKKGTVPSQKSGVPLSAGKRKLFPISEFCTRPSQPWYLKGLFPQSGLGQIFGQSGAGKSFVAIDLAYSIAIGRSWFRWQFSRTAKEHLPLVCYVVLEGVDGFGKRIKALSLREEKRQGIANPIPDNFLGWESPIDIRNPEDRLALASEILAMAEGRNIVVFIDTQAAASPALDENSSKDMGELFSAIADFQRMLAQPKSFVCMIAHAGKVVDKKNGARGWSGQKAPLELMIAVEKPDTTGGFHTLTLAKSKDAEDGEVCSFILQGIVVGLDADGDKEVSCTVEPCDNISILTEDEKKAIESLRAVYKAEGVDVGSLVQNTSWVEQYADDYNLEKTDAKNQIQYLATTLAEKKIILTQKKKNRKLVRLLEQVLADFDGVD